jgi:RNA polymerase primary sigma factor
MNAVDSYDPERGLAFGTFAAVAVRRAIHRFGVAAGEVVRVPDHVRTTRRHVRKAADHLSRQSESGDTWQHVADYLEISKQEVVEALAQSDDTVSLDALVDDKAPAGEFFPDPKALDVETALGEHETSRLVEAEVARLDERSRRIIEAKYQRDREDSSTLADIGREFGVTRERARQLESRALRALRTRSAISQRSSLGTRRRRTRATF